MTQVVYKHWDKNGVLLYVGCCGNLPVRTYGHKQSFWAGEIANVTSEEFADKRSALSAEKKAIKDEKPLYNIMHHPNREPLMRPLPEPPEHMAKSSNGGYTIHYVRYFISKICFEFGGIINWAQKNNISWSYVYEVIRGSKRPSDKILEKVGLEARIMEIQTPINPMANVCYN